MNQVTKITRKLSAKVNELLHEDRGDVPGWVLITLMTAGLVVVLWSVATPALSGILNQSLNKVANF
jgi:hypothetical protein